MKKNILMLSALLLIGSEVCASALSDAVTANNVSQVTTILQGTVNDADKNVALLMASAAGDTQIVQLLVSAGAYVDTQDSNLTTPLMQAAANDHADIVTILLNAKADTTKTDKNGKTAWNYAVATGKADVVTALLPGVSLSQSDKNTALLALVQNKAAEINADQALITAGADANAADNQKNTPLMYATSTNNIDLMKILIEAKANVNAQNKSGRSVLGFATSEEAKKLLRKNHAKPLTPFIVKSQQFSYIKAQNKPDDSCYNFTNPDSTKCSQKVCEWACSTNGGNYMRVVKGYDHKSSNSSDGVYALCINKNKFYDCVQESIDCLCER